MPRPVNKASENLFLVEVAAAMTDEQAVDAFRAEFGRPISLAALRKRRQRLGLAKKGWDGQFELINNKKGEENV